MNIIITGCAGFIGSHATECFISDETYNVIGLDLLTYAGYLGNLDNVLNHNRFTFIHSDICDTEHVESLVETHAIDWIINFAAETHVDNSIKSSKAFIQTNVEGVRSLLDVCRRKDIKLLHVSTDEVYGSTASKSFSEQDRLSPANPYSATKAAAEHLIHAYSNTYDLSYMIVRPTNNFGPRQHREKLLPTIIGSLCENKKIPIYGTGENVRDWLFVKDTARAIKFILESSSLNETYNISSSNEMKNVDLIKKALSYMDKLWHENITFVKDRPGHDFRYSISSQKLSSLGFNRFSNFDEALLETIVFYREEYSEKNNV